MRKEDQGFKASLDYLVRPCSPQPPPMKLKSNKVKQKMGYRTSVLISPVGRSAKEEKVPEAGAGKDRPKVTGTAHSKLKTATEKEAGKGPSTMRLQGGGAALRSGPTVAPKTACGLGR